MHIYNFLQTINHVRHRFWVSNGIFLRVLGEILPIFMQMHHLQIIDFHKLSLQKHLPPFPPCLVIIFFFQKVILCVPCFYNKYIPWCADHSYYSTNSLWWFAFQSCSMYSNWSLMSVLIQNISPFSETNQVRRKALVCFKKTWQILKA